MTKIGLVIKGHGEKSQYWNANVKPFVDLSYGLQSIGEEPVLFIDDSQRHLDEKINSIIQDKVPKIYFCQSCLEKQICESGVKYLVVDDDVELMENILQFRNKGYKIAVFVQYLFGVNTNKRDKRASSVALTVGSYIPWKFLIRKYKNLLLGFDYVIPNSQTCGYVLRQFYDIMPAGTVYPPVGLDMRPFLDSSNTSKEKSGLLIFAGNIINDHFSRNLSEEIRELKSKLGEPVRLFVSNPETTLFFSQIGVELYSNLPVSELAKLYSKSRFTYIPTTYELFGYVGAESLLCGTPVILDVFHPFLESVPMETKAVTIAHPNCKILNLLLKIMNDNADIETAKKSIFERYSPEESARSLLRAIEI
jgi:aromatic ring-opening dioxygenase LigB subunit